MCHLSSLICPFHEVDFGLVSPWSTCIRAEGPRRTRHEGGICTGARRGFTGCRFPLSPTSIPFTNVCPIAAALGRIQMLSCF